MLFYVRFILHRLKVHHIHEIYVFFSSQFCGAVISGLSLLSPSVMRFKHEKFCNVKVDALLRPRSLYIIKYVTLKFVLYRNNYATFPRILRYYSPNILVLLTVASPKLLIVLTALQ